MILCVSFLVNLVLLFVCDVAQYDMSSFTLHAFRIPLMVPYLLLVALSATAARPLPTSPDAALMELLQSLSLKTPAGAGQSYGGRTELVARDPVKFFFRTLDDNKKGSVRPIEKGVTLKGTNLDFLGGLTHLRLLPGSFPSDMHFHFDGAVASASAPEIAAPPNNKNKNLALTLNPKP